MAGIGVEGCVLTDQAIRDKFKNWQSLDIIVVLGASMEQDSKTHKWKMEAIVQSDPSKVVAGHSRAIAAKQIYEQGFSGIFAITGGTQPDFEGNKISRAEVLAEIMTVKYKIPKKQIAVIGKDGHGNTLGNITDVVNYIKTNDHLLLNNRIGLLTNEWHITRALFMFKEEPFFIHRAVEIKPIIADEILEERSKWHRQWVETFQNLPEMAKRKELEKSGLINYIKGNYKTKSS